MTSGRTVGIGAVLAALGETFPDISISKIRYLEAQGLITPQRTPKGSRRYSDADVERLRFVLTAQRDRFWPLKVIREHLDALDRGLVVDEATGQARAAAPPAGERTDPDVLAPRAPLRLTASELAEAAGIDESTLRDLVSYGLVRPAGEHHGQDDLDVARAAAVLVAAGIEVRHLRPFRTAAEREVGLVEHVRAQRSVHGRGPVEPDPGAQARTVAAACLDLHTALVRAQLQHLDD